MTKERTLRLLRAKLRKILRCGAKTKTSIFSITLDNVILKILKKMKKMKYDYKIFDILAHLTYKDAAKFRSAIISVFEDIPDELFIKAIKRKLRRCERKEIKDEKEE